MKMYEDRYVASFGPNSYADMKAEQKALESQTSWDLVTSRLEVTSLEDSFQGAPMDILTRANSPTNTIRKELLIDTAENTMLLINFDGREYCVRDCAMPSLTTTAGVKGACLTRTKKENLAKGLTYFLDDARECSKIMIRAEKVSAVLSSRYEYMPISDLLDICDDLQQTFGPAEFMGGELSHGMTVAQYRFPSSAKAATAAYKQAMAIGGRSGLDVVPVIEFRSSDTTDESAKLLTYLQLRPGQLFPVGEGISVAHRPPLEYDANGNRLTGMEKFKQEAATLFAKMELDIKTTIPKMLKVEIDHPANTFIGLCKYAGIPQKWGGLVEEDLRLDWPDGSGCTFLDVYESLTRVTAYAVQEGYKPQSTRIMNLEEGMSKIVRNQSCWKKYDLPGTVAWS